MDGKQTSFKTKVLVPTMIIFVVSVLILSAINYRLLDSIVKEKTDKNLEIFTDSILAQLKHLDIILDTTKNTLNKKHIAIAKSIAYILDNVPTEMTPEALQRLAEPLDILELSIADSNGILLVSNIPEYIGFDYKSTEPTRAYMALAKGTLSELAEEPRMSMTDERIDGDINHYTGVARKGGGFVQLGFNAEVIGKLNKDINIEITISETKLGDNGYGIVLSNGLIYAHPNENMLGSDVTRQNWYQAVSSGNGFKWIEINGRSYYTGYKNESGKTVIGLIPKTDFNKMRNQLLVETIILLAIAIFVMLYALYLIMGRIIAPIKELSEGLNQIAKGDLSRSLAVGGNDEIGQLSRNLSTVVNQFISLTHDINDVSKELLVNGEIFYQIDSSKYNCDYRNVIDGINGVSAAIGTELREIMTAFTLLSKGSYTTTLRPFPGKKAEVNESFNLVRENLKARELMVSGINYASKIQKSLLPPESIFEEAFADYSIIWKPKDIVGGDIYWIKNFDEGTLLCVCDCTGHGTPGALLTMLVVSIFEAVVNSGNYKDTAEIVWELEKRLVGVLGTERGSDIKDGCDLAVLYIAKDGSVSISSKNINVFVCDGLKATRLRGQRTKVGRSFTNKEDIKVIVFPVIADNKFYIASDGLYDQIGGEEEIPFGYDIFEEVILENHHKGQAEISAAIWEVFENYRGRNLRRDDFELITFLPKIQGGMNDNV